MAVADPTGKMFERAQKLLGAKLDAGTFKDVGSLLEKAAQFGERRLPHALRVRQTPVRDRLHRRRVGTRCREGSAAQPHDEGDALLLKRVHDRFARAQVVRVREEPRVS